MDVFQSFSASTLDGSKDVLTVRDVVERLHNEIIFSAKIEQAISPDVFNELQQHLGVSSVRPDLQPTVEGAEFIGDFSARGKPADDKEVKPTPNERLHSDSTSKGLAGFGIYYVMEGKTTTPMQFVDMRAVYDQLSPEMRNTLMGLETVGHTRTGEPLPPQPLLAMHPRTNWPLLMLPNRPKGHIPGLSEQESKDQLNALWHLVETSDARIEIPLCANTLVIWDNLSVVHNNPPMPRTEDRRVWFFNTHCDQTLLPLLEAVT